MCPCIEKCRQNDDVVIDLYLWNSGLLADAEMTQQEVRSVLNQAGFPRPVRRIVVAVAGPGSGEGMAGMQHFTYQPSAR